MDPEIVAFVKDGTYRLKILDLLKDKSLLSGEIATKLNVHRASTSRILTSLKEKELVTTNKGNTRTVIYSISKRGKEILEGISNAQ
jgi:DNA-binding MarR family transcriptional regulator